VASLIAVGFGGHGNVNMSAFFQLYVVAMFVCQSIFNSEISISLIGSTNGNLRPFRLALACGRYDFVDGSGHRRGWLFWNS
jgi:hypothetical protein